MDRERPHSIESLQASDTPLRIRCDDDFSIGRGPEKRSQALKLAANLQIVVDLAVIGDPVTPLIAHGLMTACVQINDRQTPMTEREGPTEMVTRIVRTSVRDDVGDPPDPRFIDGPARFVDDTANSTHVRRSETRSLPGVPCRAVHENLPSGDRSCDAPDVSTLS